MRKPLPLSFFLDIASEYEGLLMEHGRHGSVSRLAHNHGVSKQAASKWLAEARSLGIMELAPAARAPRQRPSVRPYTDIGDNDAPVDVIEADADLIQRARAGLITAHHCHREPPFHAEIVELEAASRKAMEKASETQRRNSWAYASAVSELERQQVHADFQRASLTRRIEDIRRLELRLRTRANEQGELRRVLEHRLAELE